jgi:2-polyprenyl-3-methyl-5-hydroxy-6-metoxy-1,4-benzoquinol methylase
MDKSIDYYNTHAAEYFQDTISADMRDAHKRFLRYLSEGALILDLGCGSGRDSMAFIKQGFRVDSVDGSVELCKRAEAAIHHPIQQMHFDELSAQSKYDGIWACASLLHVPKNELRSVLNRVAKALKPGGVFYLSVKQGVFEGYRNGRYFADYQIRELKSYFEIENFLICEFWISKDVRPSREDNWINLIAIINP